MKQIIKTAFSTCPNDTFIFDALVNKRIDTDDFQFEYTTGDIDQLNMMAATNSFDLIKVSYAMLPEIIDNYVAITAGGALGFNCGPMLVAKKPALPANTDEIKIVVPGKDTTANYLLTRYFPQLTNKKIVIFSEIEDNVVRGDADAGVIIHESRFTYQSKGLHLVADLGKLWHLETGLPIPLGCIVVKRSLKKEAIFQINGLLKKSVQFAFNHPEESSLFVKSFADSENDEVISQHIALYVNEFSSDLGKEGKHAVRNLLLGRISPEATLFSDDIE